MRKGKFIVIEGVDGSGKTTQHRLLLRYFKKQGISVLPVKFPRYGEPAAYFVEKYLRGEYGQIRAWRPEVSSLFYALDRFDAAVKIREALMMGKVVLADRYFVSNLGHQGAKIKGIRERKEFFEWLHYFEFEVLKIPKPDVNIFLDVPPRASFAFVKKRKRRDIHETDLSYLTRSYEAYQTAIKLFPQEITVLECAPQAKLLAIRDVYNILLEVVMRYLD